MPFVLAIEPDPRQAGLLEQVVRTQVRTEIVVVASKDEALDELRQRVPDLILTTALLSPRDEAELSGYLRTMDGASHLQTLTIPLLAAPQEAVPKRGVMGILKRSKRVRTMGCDPRIFAEEVIGYLERAREAKEEVSVREADSRRREGMLAAAQLLTEAPPVESTIEEPAIGLLPEEPATLGEDELIARLRAAMHGAAPTVALEPLPPFYGIGAVPAEALRVIATAQSQPVQEPATGFFGAALASAAAMERTGAALAPRPVVEEPIGFFGVSASPAPVIDLIGRVLVTRRGPPVVGLALSHENVTRVASSMEGTTAAWRRPAFLGTAVASNKVRFAVGASLVPEPAPIAFLGLAALAGKMREAVGLALLPPPIPVPAPFFGLAALPGDLLTLVAQSLRPPFEAGPEFVLTPPPDELLDASSEEVDGGSNSATPPPGFVHAFIHVDALEMLPLEMLGTTNDLEIGAEDTADTAEEPARPAAHVIVNPAAAFIGLSGVPSATPSSEPVVVMPPVPHPAAVAVEEKRGELVPSSAVLTAAAPDNLAWVGKAIEELLIELRELKERAPVEPAAAPGEPAESAASKGASKTKGAGPAATGSKTRATARPETTATVWAGRSKTAGKAARSRAKHQGTPLAVWVRRSVARPAEERACTTNDLRAMMTDRAVPQQVLAITFARGCRIRRIRVAKPKRKQRQKSAAHEPVIILSRKVLRELQLGNSLKGAFRRSNLVLVTEDQNCKRAARLPDKSAMTKDEPTMTVP